VDSSTDEEIDQEMSGDNLIDRVFQVMYSSESIPYVPFVLSEVAAGNYAALDDLESGAMTEGSYRQPNDEDVSDSEGMNLSVECQEEIAFLDEATAVNQVPAQPAPLHDNSVNTIQGSFSDCQIWNVETADPIESQPVISDVPTLVAAGEFDPITPATWAESAASYLSNSFFFVFPGGGHGVIDMNACSQSIMQAFLDNPTEEPDGSCISEIGEPQWALPSE
jgi:pimeloyl-ACP methyl ester carboxylesterase